MIDTNWTAGPSVTTLERVRRLCHGEDASDVDELLERIAAFEPGERRLALALRGHPVGRDLVVAAMLDEVDPFRGILFPESLGELISRLDEWARAQADASAFEAAQLHVDSLLEDHAAWRCGWDPASTETLLRSEGGTFCVHLDAATRRWHGGPATLHDILRLTRLADERIASERPSGWGDAGDVLVRLQTRLRELGEAAGESAGVAVLCERLAATQPGRHRLLLALRGHPLGRDETIVAVLDTVESMLACRVCRWPLEDVLADLDEWSAFLVESFGLDRDLFSESPFTPSRFHPRLQCLLVDRALWRCGWDPMAHEALVFHSDQTSWIRMDPSTYRWQGGLASLHDILRLTRLAET